MRTSPAVAAVFTFIVALCLAIVPSAAEKSCLWKVGSEGNEIYVLGSIHFLKAKHYPLAPAIETAYGQADGLVFEASIDSLQSPQHQAALMVKGFYEEGGTLKDHISKETYTKVRKRVETLGTSVTLLEPFRPWLAALTVSVLEIQRLGFQPQWGVDLHFHNRAKEDGKVIEALESTEFQIDLFAGIEEDRQEAFLEYTLSELDNAQKFLDRIVTSWRSGDVDGLQRFLNEELLKEKEWQGLVERVLFARNEAWIPRIEQLLQSGKTYLVVVGAAHVVGHRSVIDLLEKKGYTIEQM
jgi:uncharacterized protein YbaP (TraB family)